VSGTAGLEPFRRRLDSLDEQIAQLLGERFATCREIALYKREHAIPMMQPERVAEVRARYIARGADAQLPPDYVQALFELTIAATCKMEDELIGQTGGRERASAGDACGPERASAGDGANAGEPAR
jgi:chorismate mutase